METFEYLRLDINDGSHPIDWTELGKQGYELVCISHDVAYFKRSLQIKKANKKYSHDTVQGGYVVHNNETLQRLSALEVLELLNR